MEIAQVPTDISGCWGSPPTATRMSPTLSSSGTSKKIITSFFSTGIGSSQFTKTLAEAHKYRWSEE